MKLHEAFSPEESSKIYDNFLAIVNDKKRRDRLVSKHGKNAEAVAYGTAVNQVKKQAENPIEEPPTEEIPTEEIPTEEIPTEEIPTEEPMEDNKLKEMVIAALINPKKADLNKDGKLSSYEKKRGAAIEKNIPESTSKHTVKYSKSNDTYQVWLADEIVTDFATKEKADAEAKRLNALQDVKRIDKAQVDEDLDLGHEDNEPHMLKADLYRIGKYAMELYKMVDKFEGGQEVDFPHWWQAKIINAKSCLVSAKHYLDFELKEPQIDAMVDVASEEGVIDELIRDKDITSAPHTNVKTPPKGKGDYNPKERAANLKALSNFGPKKEMKEKIKEVILAKLKNK
jgi:hypothetical protein